jgi:uncharacterized membrane protein
MLIHNHPVRTLARVLLAGLGIFVVTIVLVTAGTTAFFLASSGQQVVGLLVVSTLVGFLFATLAILVVGLVLVQAVIVTVQSVLAAWRIGLYEWAVDVEASTPWAQWVHFAERFEPIDPRTPEERTATAVDELKTRYVRGEITEHEFEADLERLLEDGSRLHTTQPLLSPNRVR